MQKKANLNVVMILSLNTESGVRAPFKVMLITKILLHRKQKMFNQESILARHAELRVRPLPFSFHNPLNIALHSSVHSSTIYYFPQFRILHANWKGEYV